MSPVAELPEATENATQATPEATPGNGAPQAAAAGADAASQSPRALLKQLQQQFKAFRDCLPLAIGIDKQVLSRLPNLNRKGYLAFDLSKFAGHKFTETELVLTIEPSELGFASFVPDSTFAVYGLIDESEDHWEETSLNWAHAPAQDPLAKEGNQPVAAKAKLLGRFEIA